MKHAKRWISMIMALAMTVCLAACGGNDSDVSTSGGDSALTKDSIVCALIVEPDRLDPHQTTSHRSRQVNVNIYESLLKQNDDGELKGLLAENWEVSDDGLVYTFYLRKGVLFHNGEEMKASDVVFSINRGVESSYVQQFFPNVSEVTELDEYTVQITLDSPVSFFETLMSLPMTAIVSEKAVEEAGEDFGRNPCGTGPYKFVNWVSGSSISLEAFEDYWQGEAAIKNCEYRVVTDTTSGIISLQNGEIDFFYEMAATEKETCDNDPNLVYEDGASTSYEHIVINNENEILQDENLRKALAYATDKESIIVVATNGSGIRADSQVSPSMELFCEDITGYEFDIEKAKEYMAKSNYPDGVTLTLQVNSGYREDIATILMADYAEIGVTLNLQVLEFNTVSANMMAGDFELILIGRNLHMNNPILGINLNFNSANSGASGNYQRYKNPDVDAALAELYVETDPARQQELMEGVLTALQDDVANIPLYWSSWSIAYNSALKNVEYRNDSYYHIYDFSW